MNSTELNLVKIESSGRRLVSVPVSFEFLRDLITKGARIPSVEVVEGLPQDALFCGTTFSESELVAYLFFIHESFEPVAQGGIVPRVMVTYRLIAP